MTAISGTVTVDFPAQSLAAEMAEMRFPVSDDDVVGVIRMFDTLRRQFPQQIVSHAPLAIAVAVVWDNEKGVYRYGHHSNRTGSVMPTDLVDGTTEACR